MYSHKRLLSALLGVLLFVMGHPTLDAQSVSSSIQGAVVDTSGAVVPDAEVSLTNAGTGTLRKTRTDTAGSYSFPSVSPGVYSLAIAKSGFTQYQVSQLNIVVGQRVTELMQ